MAAKSGGVGNYALQSRILVLFMQAFFNFLIPDHNADVFNPPSVHRGNSADKLIEVVFAGFKRWDAIYFLHISEYGYTYENTLAFFPLFPFTVRVIANTVLFPLQFFLTYGNILLLAAFCVNLICYVQATKYLHKLTMIVMQDEALALKVVQLFCINPASIFFSAPYTEAMFALFTFGGMLNLEGGYFLRAAVLFGLSGATRSNGLINLGFILYKQLLLVKNIIKNNETVPRKLLDLFKVCAWTAIYGIAVALPFILYQLFAYHVFCNQTTSDQLPEHILAYGKERRYKMAHTGPSEWCSYTVPISYSYVQNKHWNVGFLSYYELRQIPNFMMALPVVVLTVAALVTYAYRNPMFCLTLGLYSPRRDGLQKKTDDPVAWFDISRSYGFHSRHCFVYLVHLVAMTTVCMLVMHVQVVTRFICCSSPLFYFFVAWITVPEGQRRPLQTDSGDRDVWLNNGSARGISEGAENSDPRPPLQGFMEWEDDWVNKAIYVYFDLYFFVGIAAFSNFLPFT